jgi:predicted  nucleic acid-binding Zn-ribbon protein
MTHICLRCGTEVFNNELYPEDPCAKCGGFRFYSELDEPEDSYDNLLDGQNTLGNFDLGEGVEE